jgi:hypothetical protein
MKADLLLFGIRRGVAPTERNIFIKVPDSFIVNTCVPRNAAQSGERVTRPKPSNVQDLRFIGAYSRDGREISSDDLPAMNTP